MNETLANAIWKNIVACHTVGIATILTAIIVKFDESGSNQSSDSNRAAGLRLVLILMISKSEVAQPWGRRFEGVPARYDLDSNN